MPFMRVNGGVMVASSVGISMMPSTVTLLANLGGMTPNLITVIVTVTSTTGTGFLHYGQYKTISLDSNFIRFGFQSEGTSSGPTSTGFLHYGQYRIVSPTNMYIRFGYQVQGSSIPPPSTGFLHGGMYMLNSTKPTIRFGFAYGNNN